MSECGQNSRIRVMLVSESQAVSSSACRFGLCPLCRAARDRHDASIPTISESHYGGRACENPLFTLSFALFAQLYQLPLLRADVRLSLHRSLSFMHERPLNEGWSTVGVTSDWLRELC